MKLTAIFVFGCIFLLGCGLTKGDNATTSILTLTSAALQSTSSSSTSPPTTTSSTSCFSSRLAQRACCMEKIRSFKERWFTGGSYLQKFFNDLKELGCRRNLISFCKRQLFARFSDYSRLVYDYHCEPPKFQEECIETIAVARGIEKYFESNWTTVVAGMSSDDFSTEDLEKPCIQVALYDSKSGGNLYYHEIIDVYTPFCDVSWCGFDARSIETRGLSSWNCITSGCRTNLIIASVVCALLATAIVLANVTVIIVFSTSPKLRNSQAVYKISLAIADLVVGLLVLPTFVSTLMLLYQGKTSMGAVLSKLPANSEGTLPRRSGGRFMQRLPNEYVNFVGFITILSIIVSIYTLMMASFDRFMAMFQPLRYSHHRAKRLAMWSSLSLWITAIIFSAIPLFVREMSYGIAASIMVVSLKTPALILYAVVILLPLVLVWVTTFATFLSTRQHARVRKTMRIRRGSQAGATSNSNIERRLAVTLGAMVGTFTACLLPAVIILVLGLVLPNIYFDDAENVNPSASKTFLSVEFAGILILMTNSLWNCFIYNARSVEFKKKAKDLYARMLSAMGFNIIWRKTRNFASSTMRSRRSTMTTSLFFSMRRSRKFSGESSRSNDLGVTEGDGVAGNGTARYSESCTATTGTNVYRYNLSKMEAVAELDSESEAKSQGNPRQINSLDSVDGGTNPE